MSTSSPAHGFPLDAARDAVRRALAEDASSDDITTRWSVPATSHAEARVIAMEDGVLAGLPVAAEVYRQVDPDVVVAAMVEEGAPVRVGEVVPTVRGAAASVSGERTALNFLQRSGGIATLTSRFVEAVQGLPVAVLDTRKTAPGLGALDKYAVSAGGSRNHRMDLSAMVLLKENHVAAAGGVTAALEAVRDGMAAEGRDVAVDIEVETVAQAEEALQAGAAWIMLDNMSLSDIRQVVALRAGPTTKTSVFLEASGNVTLTTARRIAETGVDAISVGALTHNAAALDLSLVLGASPRP
jgi:nicotinate-nucleotide pyrophosphorylase (carboxylating)